jgi:hypothetical protein
VDAEERVQVGLGCHLVVTLVDEQGGRESLAFDLVPEEAADFARGQLSEKSPLGAALRGRFAGDEVDYRMGDVVRVRIESVGPAQQEADKDAAARRQAVLDEARRKAERTNADMFASSFSGKWGDYDTEGMDDLDD